MDWDPLRRFLRLRRAGVPADKASRALDSGSFVADVEWHRAEELRPMLAGVPDEDEIRHDAPHDAWRPVRTLGKLPRS